MNTLCKTLLGVTGLMVATHLSSSRANEQSTSAGDDVPTSTQTLLTRADPAMPLGARLYLDNCAACHAVTGKGAAGIFPALDGNPIVGADAPEGLISIILRGAELPTSDERPMRLRMPDFGWRLSDEDIAALATFVRQAWHNQAGAVRAAQVAPVR